MSRGAGEERRLSRILSRLFLADTTTTTTRVYFSLGIASGGQSKNPFINLSVRPLFMLTASPREGRLIRPRVGPQLEVFVCDRLTPFIGTSCCKQMVNTSLESIPFHGQNIVDDGEKLPQEIIIKNVLPLFISLSLSPSSVRERTKNGFVKRDRVREVFSRDVCQHKFGQKPVLK